MLARDQEDLLRRLDRRILYPVLAAYCCSYVDRSNISNALTSLERSIGLTPRYYALSAALFTLSLVLVEIPSNAILKNVGPRTWLATLVAGCGICTIVQGAVGSWQALIGVRTVLGLFEGGVFPGALFALTLYYPPEHLTVRISAFTLAASFAFAAGAFLAGVLLPWGSDGWRALFVFQGGLTLAVSLVLYALLPASSTRASSFGAHKALVKGGNAAEEEDDDECESRLSRSGGAVDPPAFLPAHLRALFSLIHMSQPLSPAIRPSSHSRVDNEDTSGQPAQPSADDLSSRPAAGRWPPLFGGQLVHRSREPSPDRAGGNAFADVGVWRPTASALKASSTTTTPLLTTPAEEGPPGPAAVVARAYFSGAAVDVDSTPSRPTSRSSSAFAPATPSAAASAASSIGTTLLAPLTWVLSLAYLFLLLATTPSTFLPRLLSARWALSEPAANTAVGLLYTLGGCGQFAVGYIAGRPEGPGLLTTWRRAAAATVGCWVLVAAYEAALGGEGVVALEASRSSSAGGNELGGWEWVGPPAARWTGVLLRLAATMATPTLGSLYLSHTVSLPTTLVPNRAILTACVISIGNLAQALGPPLYASCLPLLASPAFPGGTPTPTPDAPLPPDDVPHIVARRLLALVSARSSNDGSASTAAASTVGFEYWRGLAARDLAMGLAVLVTWAAVEGISRYAASEVSRQRLLLQQQQQTEREAWTSSGSRRGRSRSIDDGGRPSWKDTEREEQAGLLAGDPP